MVRLGRRSGRHLVPCTNSANSRILPPADGPFADDQLWLGRRFQHRVLWPPRRPTRRWAGPQNSVGGGSTVPSAVRVKGPIGLRVVAPSNHPGRFPPVADQPSTQRFMVAARIAKVVYEAEWSVTNESDSQSKATKCGCVSDRRNLGRRSSSCPGERLAGGDGDRAVARSTLTAITQRSPGSLAAAGPTVTRPGERDSRRWSGGQRAQWDSKPGGDGGRRVTAGPKLHLAPSPASARIARGRP